MKYWAEKEHGLPVMHTVISPVVIADRQALVVGECHIDIGFKRILLCFYARQKEKRSINSIFIINNVELMNSV
jgi:hypothetical protein